jgi:hypothetical protein
MDSSEFGNRKSDPPSSDGAGLWRGKHAEGGKKMPGVIYPKPFTLNILPSTLSLRPEP